MKTKDLIASLAHDAGRPGMSPRLALFLAVCVASVIAATMLLTTMGVRPDFQQALGTWRFDFKFVVVLAFGIGVLALLVRAPYPQGLDGVSRWPLVVGPALLLAGVGVELATLPTETWAMSAIGKNAYLCLTVIPALGIVPLGLVLWSLRRGAPTRPTLTGLLAGLLAGAIAATFYAANCTDDSPLFVVTWYPIAILALGLAGAAAGRVALRW